MPLGGSSRAWVARQVRDPYVKKADLEGFRSRAAFKLLELQARFRLVARGDVVVDLGAAPGSWSQAAAQLCGSRGAGVEMPPPAAAAPARRYTAPGGRASVLDAASCDLDAALPPLEAAGAAAAPPPPPARAQPGAAPAAAVRGSGPGAPRGGGSGLVVACDLLRIEPLPGVVTIQGDFTRDAVQQRVFEAIQRHRGGGAWPAGAAGGGGGGAHPAQQQQQQQANVLLSDLAHSFTGEAHTDHLRQMQLSWTALLAAPSLLARGGHLAVKVRYGEAYRPFLAAVERRFRRVVEVKPPASRAESAEAFIVGLAWCGAPRALAASAATPDEAAALAQFGLSWPHR
jgi:23S rRNA U2552 (ribose-2'-O)-methylase RlmE/FtsJ